MHEDDGEFRAVAGATFIGALPRIPLRAAACARRPSTRRVGAGGDERARGLGERGAGRHHVVDERDARVRARSPTPRMRRGHCAGARPTAAWPAADPRRRARAAPRAATRCARDVDGDFARLVEPALALPRGRERQRDDALRAIARARPASESRTAEASAAPAHSASAIRPPYLIRWSKRSIGKA